MNLIENLKKQKKVRVTSNPVNLAGELTRKNWWSISY